MEGGGPFFPSGQLHQHESSGFVFLEAENASEYGGSPINPNVNNEKPRAMREHDQYMPIANVIRIMRRILPSHAKISDEAKETVQECVSEYISFITSEANHRCREEQRKTVTAEDVLWAISKLGFDNYVQPLSAFLSRYRDGGDGGSCPLRQHVMAPQFAHAPQPLPPCNGSGYRVYPNPMAMGGHYMASGSSSGSSSSAPMDHDPYAHVKRDRY